MTNKKFVAVINCMDGRVQLPVNSWLKHKFNADYVDTITEPGPVKIIAEANDSSAVASIKKKLEISLSKHHASAIAIAAHADCAGNPVADEIQLEQLRRAVEIIKQWGYEAQVIGLWVNEKWEVEEA